MKKAKAEKYKSFAEIDLKDPKQIEARKRIEGSPFYKIVNTSIQVTELLNGWKQPKKWEKLGSLVKKTSDGLSIGYDYVGIRKNVEKIVKAQIKIYEALADHIYFEVPKKKAISKKKLVAKKKAR